jgi:hypothetical protein
MILLDSNVLIYLMNGQKPKLFDWISQHHTAVSVITRIEVLGFHKLSDQQKWLAEQLLNMSRQLTISDDVVQRAILLKQQRAIKLGDAMIAATALTYQIPLATYNSQDFIWTGVQLLEMPL